MPVPPSTWEGLHLGPAETLETAIERVMAHEDWDARRQADVVRELWRARPLPAALAAEISAAYARLAAEPGEDPPVAIRSSVTRRTPRRRPGPASSTPSSSSAARTAVHRAPEAGLGRLLDGAGHRPAAPPGQRPAGSRRRHRRPANGRRACFRRPAHRLRRQRAAPRDGDQRRAGPGRGRRVRHRRRGPHRRLQGPAISRPATCSSATAWATRASRSFGRGARIGHEAPGDPLSPAPASGPGVRRAVRAGARRCPAGGSPRRAARHRVRLRGRGLRILQVRPMPIFAAAWRETLSRVPAGASGGKEAR